MARASNTEVCVCTTPFDHDIKSKTTVDAPVPLLLLQKARHICSYMIQCDGAFTPAFIGQTISKTSSRKYSTEPATVDQQAVQGIYWHFQHLCECKS